MLLLPPLLLLGALRGSASLATTPNNRRPGLLPPVGGAWRGAELGSQFLPPNGAAPTGAAKLADYSRAYPRTPLHVYRSFNLTVGPGVRAWVAQGGILWYNIKTSKQMSWQTGARGGFDREALAWAAQVKSLAPAQVFVTIFHEPDHNICYVNCTEGGVPGNSPANYRNMWRSIQGVFKSEGVTNAVWVIDYSVQMANATHMNDECSEASCPAAAAVAPLWPGDDVIDWVFVNLFEKAKKHGIKADYATMLEQSLTVLRNVNRSGHCHCVPGKDGHCHGCDLAAKPWGLGAFASHGLPVDGKPAVPTAERVKFLQDAAGGMAQHPELKAYLYFDSLDSEVPLNGSEPEVEAAFQRYLASPPFALGDAGAPPAGLQDGSTAIEQTGSCNLVPAGVLLGTGSLAMVKVNGSASCCQACAAHASCVAFSYEPTDRKCYLKDNSAKQGKCKHSGCVSGTISSAPPAPPSPPAGPSTVAATLTLNGTSPIARFSPHFLGVNADWWLDGCGGEGVNWSDNASIALLDLGNPRLKVLAKGLSGGTLRVGGTHGDSVTYGVGPDQLCPSAPKRCYPICLTAERWKAIVGFASDAGLKLAFGLNMQATNLSNIEELLRYTKQEGLQVDTFELGNELGITHIEQLGAGPDDAGDGDDASRAGFTTLVREQSYLRAITFHAYPFHNGGGPTPSLVQHMMTPRLLDQGVATYSQMIAAVKAGATAGGGGASSMPEVWMGEGNAAGHGGRLGVTNTFINSFWYLNAMASAASLGIARFNRQTLIGGGYELVNRSTFEPNPDYFAALLWRQLVGTTALQLGVQQQFPRSVSLMGSAAAQSDVLRAYAFCARSSDASNSSDAAGDVVILGLNFSPTQAVNLTLPVRAGVGAGAAGSRRAWYVRSAMAGSGALAAEALRAPSVALRSAAAGDDEVWTTLRLEGTLSEPTLPSLDGVTESAGAPLVLQPQSYAFVLLSGLAPQACAPTSE